VQTVSPVGSYLGDAWSPQGVILYQPESTGSGLYRVPAGGGAPTEVTHINAGRREISHRFPQFLPDGRHFIYWVWSAVDEDTGIYVGSLDPADKVPEGPLVHTWREARYAEPGYLLYLEGSMLKARRFDPSRLRLEGDPRVFADEIAVDRGFTGHASFSISATGTLAYQEALPQPQARIVVRDRAGNQLRTIDAPPGAGFPTLDPREKNVVVQGEDKNTLEELWNIDFDRGISSRLSPAHASNMFAVWSPDGQRIAFRSNRSGTYEIWVKDVTGKGDEELLAKCQHLPTPDSWSTDGEFLIYEELNPVTRNDIWVLQLKGDRKPFPFLKTGFDEADGRLSPVADGQGHFWMAYTSDETGAPEVYLRQFLPGAPGGPAGPEARVSTAGGAAPLWRKDGRELFYLEHGTLMAVDVKLGTPLEIGVPHKLFDAPIAESQHYAVFGDGQRFLFTEPAGEPLAAKINVVVNWAAGLER
jgi:hypothetical protein